MSVTLEISSLFKATVYQWWSYLFKTNVQIVYRQTCKLEMGYVEIWCGKHKEKK